HAHADALSFQLWVDGRPAVVDPGTYTYEAGADRDWFRSTRAHSTVAVDGRDQFELWGAFRAGRLPRVRLLGDAPLEAEVDAGSLRHRRSISVRDGAVVVEDTVDAAAGKRVESTLPLAEYAPVVPEPLSASELREGRGWLSESMFVRTPIPVLT